MIAELSGNQGVISMATKRAVAGPSLRRPKHRPCFHRTSLSTIYGSRETLEIQPLLSVEWDIMNKWKSIILRLKLEYILVGLGVLLMAFAAARLTR